MEKLFHQHLLIKAYVENPPVEEAHLERWLTELVADVKMKVVIPARAHFVADEGNEGLTGSVNISTSHCAIHVWSNEKPSRIEMDLYSCSCFEVETILNKLREFGLVSHEYMMIDRNESFKVLTHITQTP